MTCTTERRPRGFALPLVLTLLFVMFLLASTVSGLSIDNARMVMHHQQQTIARQAALAGVAEAQAWCDQSADWSGWSTVQPTWAGTNIQPDSAVPAFYSLTVEAGATTDTCVVDAAGWMTPSGDKTPAATVSEKAYFQRADAAFLYPLQSNGVVTLTGTTVSSPANGIALRVTNSTIALGAGSTINGDVLSTNSSQSINYSGGLLNGTEYFTAVTAMPVAPVVPAYMNLAGLKNLQNITLPH